MNNNDERDYDEENANRADMKREGIEEHDDPDNVDMPDPDDDDPNAGDDPNQGPLQGITEAQIKAWARTSQHMQYAGTAGVEYGGVKVTIGVRDGHLYVDVDPNGADEPLLTDVQPTSIGVLPIIIRLNGDTVFDHQYPDDPTKALKTARRTDEASFRRRAPKSFDDGATRIDRIVHFLPGNEALRAAAIVICFSGETGWWSTDTLVEDDSYPVTHPSRWYLRDHERASGFEQAMQYADARIRALR